ncbi:P22 phage major capsid protein family protein [Xanthomonas sp. NCPPB 3005]|uniref:P22 phage major capsid protein family protein n=1 Tax=Xanthomonas sp. NCPPB 3005 TaxID=3240913 RepID=UPI003517EFA8
MANVGQALTHQMVARLAAKMLVEDNEVVSNINTDRSIEFGEEVNGYGKGDTVRVMIPPVPVVYDGAVFAGGSATAPSLKETSVDLTLDTQKHVGLTFTAKEKKLEITEFKKRFLKPAMEALGSQINADLLNRMRYQTPNVVGTWGTIPSTRTTYRAASASLNRFLAPKGDRSLHFSSDANIALAEANSTLFHTKDELEAEFSENAVGMFAGFQFYEQQSLALQANGAGAGYVVNGAAQTGASLAVTTGTGPLTRGTVFTIAGVNAVHPITGVDSGVLRQFVVTADYAGGAGNVAIYPAIIPTSSTVIGTVTASPANSANITVFGTASQSKRQGIAFHRDAFAAAFAPLPVLASCEGYTATVGKISVRVMTFGDGYNDRENTRIDVLYGEAPVRRDHSVRITE